MFTIYWTELVSADNDTYARQCQWYDADGEAIELPELPPKQTPRMHTMDNLSMALAFCESLRKARRQGAPYSAITMVSENPDSVGQAGVDVTGPDYDWKKRRV